MISLFKKYITILTLLSISIYGKTDDLKFKNKNYEIKTLTIDNTTINYREYKNILYVSSPVDTKYQSLNFFVPEKYYNGEEINGYNINTAPIFLPNGVGGYMSSEPQEPEISKFNKTPNSIFVALSRGYIVASPGTRGRLSKNSNNENIGKAPAVIIDLKSAVRYLHFNDNIMPGDANKIISNGTSAGGAVSSLLGATGNNKDYEHYLDEVGAAKASDEIFAVSAYCPITNLENADKAYEWQFHNINSFKKLDMSNMIDFRKERKFVEGTMSKEQIELSNELNKLFPEYINSLNLIDKNGQKLSLDNNGNGSFKDYVKSYVINSAQKSLDNGNSLDDKKWITIINNKVIDINFEEYIKSFGRMKTTSAFDGVDLNTGENSLFGTKDIENQHFTKFGYENSTVNGTVANDEIIKLMNPMNYIGTEDNTTSKHWRIRHGSIDSDTSLAIPIILATKLENLDYDVDMSIVWDMPHSGDYDLEDLFDWADSISK